MIVKVCGMRDPDNIRRVASLRIDWMGFIFLQQSKRNVPAGEEYRRAIANCPLPKVGVFVDASLETMTETAASYKLNFLQLHGNESPDVCRALQKRGLSLLKAFAVAEEKDLLRTKEYEGLADYFLFDTKCEGYGGSGKSFNWQLLEAYKGKTPFLLSGGIRPGSLEALRRFGHPLFAGIDLNSGFETEPGMKDSLLLAAFIDAIRSAT
jgi:phosphoribosylanthranilate isomerase